METLTANIILESINTKAQKDIESLPVEEHDVEVPIGLVLSDELIKRGITSFMAEKNKTISTF